MAEIDLTAEMVSILKDLPPRGLEATIQSKFGCKSEIHGVDVDSGPSPTQPSKVKVDPEQMYSIQLSRGMTVSVWKDDLTTHKVDAVVNAANKYLQHGAGLARALCDAGGPDIQHESQQHINRYGNLQTGDAIVTKAGKLPCQWVIHAVGPELPAYPTQQIVNQASRQLQTAVENILRRAEERGVQSVAIPALSSGLFNFPLPQCAEVIVTTLKNYTSLVPLEVHLVNHDDKSVAEMKRACTSILGPGALYSQAVQNRGKGSVKAHSSYTSPGTAKPSPLTVQMFNVSLTLKMGHIEKEMADVIVNTIAWDLRLSVGEISKAISQKAGRQMQQEINQRQYGKAGDVLETKGYDLHCKEVYHTVCARRDEPAANRVLKHVIKTCLEKSARNGMLSISFPAIGTGNLGFQKKEVADIMTSTVFEFAQTFQGKMDINFVIYPTDNETMQAFKDKMMPLSSGASSHHSSTQGVVQTNNQHKSKPCIKLNSPMGERTKEAERWIYDVLRRASPITIQNNFIQHFGQFEHKDLQSLQAKWNVSIIETFQDGCASILIRGVPRGIPPVRMEVEAMCCKVQEEFAKDEEITLSVIKSQVSHQRKPMEPNTDMRRNFAGFQIVRVEKVENPSLKQVFELKKKQLSATPKQLYQRLPAQFCDLVSRVGFQREYSPPAEQKYGMGIYFSNSVHGAEKLWKNLPYEEYLYFVVAQVLTGKSVNGSPNMIVPPSVGQDPLILYDSVKGDMDTHVIFNGHQALPEYLIICKAY